MAARSSRSARATSAACTSCTTRSSADVSRHDPRKCLWVLALQSKNAPTASRLTWLPRVSVDTCLTAPAGSRPMRTSSKIRRGVLSGISGGAPRAGLSVGTVSARLTTQINRQCAHNPILNYQSHIPSGLTWTLSRLGRRSGRGSDDTLRGENLDCLNVQR